MQFITGFMKVDFSPMRRLFTLVLFVLALLFAVGGAQAFSPKNMKGMNVDLTEYLRLEVISKTLYKRTKEQPDWDKLIRPAYSEFRDAMKAFILKSIDDTRGKASAPPFANKGGRSGRIDWANMEPSKQAVDFEKVPPPWFHVQAERIQNNLDKIDEALNKPTPELAVINQLFEDIKDAVLAWQRPPFVVGTRP